MSTTELPSKASGKSHLRPSIDIAAEARRQAEQARDPAKRYWLEQLEFYILRARQTAKGIAK